MMIIGHQKQWEFLKKAAETGKIPHALLFSGQEQLGKKTLAIELAKFIIGQDIEKKTHPDFILIEPESSEIKISQIRDIIWKLSLYPYSALFKIAVIDQAHLMTQEAQNCFLKTLEEPKGKTLLILITEYPEMLVPTILSRVQKIKFFPAAKKEIEKHLVKKGISLKQAEYFSSLSLGRPGTAINFSLDNQKIKNQEKIISDLIQISNSDLGFRFQYAKNLSGKVSDILDIWLKYFRDLFLNRIYNKKERDFNQYSLPKLKKIISLIQSTNYLISTTNVNSKLALETLLIEL